MLGVIDHAPARRQFACEPIGKNFRSDNVGADGNYFLAQGGCGSGSVSAAGEQHFLGMERASSGFDTEAAAGVVGSPNNARNACVVAKAGAVALGGFSQAVNVT